MRNKRPLTVRSHNRDRKAGRAAADHIHGRDVDARSRQVRPDSLAIAVVADTANDDDSRAERR